ncbi:MAG TPA: TetR/AcrR family transcriptional regulator [Chitinophagaceae bacterium]|nr:TetR/AcrR family transcriptional regulator [Chitinophagaceae bacterium]
MKVFIVLRPMEPQERIVQKAHELFMHYGIRSVSMDEIASNLGISKKTIYQFFADKDALVEAVVNIEINANEEECGHFRDKSENPVHEFFLAMDMVDDMLKIMNPMLFYDLQKYHPSAFRKFEEHQNVFLYRVVKENLERGVQEEIYRADINIPLLSRFRLATIFLIFNPDIFPLRKNNLGEVLREITLNFLYGIATPKGQKLIQKYNQKTNKINPHE